MSRVSWAALVVVLSVWIAPWAPSAAEAGEQWVIEIQRYLDGPERCPSPHPTDNYSHKNHYQHTDTYGQQNTYNRQDKYGRQENFSQQDAFERTETYGDTETYTRQPFDNGIQNSSLLSLPPAPKQVVDTSEISCIQGTRVARQYGFRHIEVVSCDDYEVYVYEALRGRVPWRIMVDKSAGHIVEAQPLY